MRWQLGLEKDIRKPEKRWYKPELDRLASNPSASETQNPFALVQTKSSFAQDLTSREPEESPS
jgi:hypothetical protein